MHYNRWANLVLLDACIGLSDEQLESGLPGSFGTIYDTFVHLVRAEAGYIAGWPTCGWSRRSPGTAVPH